MHVKVKVKK